MMDNFSYSRPASLRDASSQLGKEFGKVAIIAGGAARVRAGAGAALGPSQLCVGAQWDVQALAVPAAGAAQTGARGEVHQGIAVRMTTSDAATGC